MRAGTVGVFLTLVLITFFLVGNASAVESILKIARATGSKSLDPGIVTSGTERAILLLATERLYQYDDKGRLIPRLAQSCEVSKDLKVYTYHLRKNVKFSDGTPLTAEAVKYSFERVIAIGAGPSKTFADVESIDVVDDFTIQITLKKANVVFTELNIAAKHGPYVVSPTAYKAHATESDPWAKDWAKDHIVGSGPYVLLEFQPGVRTIMARNESYWQGWAEKHVDKVVFMDVREYSTRKSMLQTGKADIIDNIRVQDIPMWEKTKGIRLARLETNRTTYIFFNLQKEVFKDIRVRQGISFGFDYEGGRLLMGNLVHPLHGPFPEMFFGHKKIQPYRQDLEKAKALLKEAGFPANVRMKYIYWSGSDDRRRVAELLKSNLTEIGIQLDIQPREWVTLVAEAKDPKIRPELVYYQTWPDIPEPLDTLDKLFLSSASLNVSGYSNPQVEKWAEAIRSMTDNKKRAEICAKIQEQIFADVPCLFLWTQTLVLPMRERVKNYRYFAPYNGYYDVYSMYLE